ncbi:hypothetical protein BH11BAC4_BH11BAC4_01500 [soil metagenome]
MINRQRIPGLFSKLNYYIALIPLTIFLYGCPFSSSYKMDATPGVYAEDILLGNWATMITTKNGKQLPVKMILGKKSDNEYSIAFTGYISDLAMYRVIENDTIKCTGFVSNARDRQFLNISLNEQTYIAELIYKENRLSLLPLAEKFTAKYIKSDEDLRIAVEFHIRTRVAPVYDEQFCLRDMVRVK